MCDLQFLHASHSGTRSAADKAPTGIRKSGRSTASPQYKSKQSKQMPKSQAADSMSAEPEPTQAVATQAASEQVMGITVG